MNVGLSDVGIMTDSKAMRHNAMVNGASIGIPLVGTLVGLLSSGFSAPTSTTVFLFLVFFLFNLIGVSVGLHRYFSHHAFETSPLVRWLLGIWGTWAMQGPIDRWVADHRRHHRFSDQPLDIHSPYWSRQEKITSGFMRFAHAHVLWMFVEWPTDTRLYAKDIISDPISRGCSRWYWPICATSLVVPAMIGYGMGGSDEAVRAFFWAGCLRISLMQQLTWTVNSLGHMFGGKTEGSRDESRNMHWGVTLVFLGEGLHSYHHAHQRTAVNQPASLDLAGSLITFLETIHVVWKVQRF
ncbi:fatty acid desaturase [uncultured Nitrospira sp.]|uniref:acyl-CoA desaturase n=1 Tax=uncultured Nitrospira sp. TaxID=157176 RepID=UPI003140A5AC